jgi:16S rRNA (adenine1518-N6/adenine1519-N6)-dimethyltransferase
MPATNSLSFAIMVRPKKSLGQHFLKDHNIAMKIVDALGSSALPVVEIGPGTGMLTQFLLKRKDRPLTLVEIDRDSVAYLREHYPLLHDRIVEGDFLELDLARLVVGDFVIIGNFPYNISSQIFFKVLDHRHQVREVVSMLQKEVAERIAAPHGNKTYGILSVLLQAYYDIELLFTVPPGVFFPPPRVMSAVIRLRRNKREHLDCDENLFPKVVKQAFQMRRKTLRNALKSLNLPPSISALALFDKRAEQLAVQEFIALTRLIEQSREEVRPI